MEKVSVETTQNVQIDYQLASLGDRIIAFLIDGLILAVYSIFGFFLIFSNFQNQQEWSLILFLILFNLPAFLYHLLCEVFLNGQSLGKKQMNIKVMKSDGSNASIGAYLLRWILRPVDITLFSGGIAVLTIMITEKGQRLGDLAAGTVVVKLGNVPSLTYHRKIDNPEENYQPMFDQVVNLTDQDVEIIKKSLIVYQNTANKEPVLASAEKIRKLLNLETDLPPVKLLMVVIKDYNFFASRL